MTVFLWWVSASIYLVLVAFVWSLDWVWKENYPKYKKKDKWGHSIYLCWAFVTACAVSGTGAVTLIGLFAAMCNHTCHRGG